MFTSNEKYLENGLSEENRFQVSQNSHLIFMRILEYTKMNVKSTMSWKSNYHFRTAEKFSE